jgi:fumarate reductase flavoprotein subunit
MLGLAAVLSGCAAPNDVTKNAEEPQESTIPANDGAQTEKMEKLIEQIVTQVVNRDLSIDTTAELENMGIDSDMITAFKETVVSNEDDALFNDGVYTGTGDAHNGDIAVEVTIYEGKILYIEPIEHSETAPKLEEVFKSIPLEVLREQSAQDIDAVSGATEASDGYIEAIEDALSKAQR